jgi:hypothetical protein
MRCLGFRGEFGVEVHWIMILPIGFAAQTFWTQMLLISNKGLSCDPIANVHESFGFVWQTRVFKYIIWLKEWLPFKSCCYGVLSTISVISFSWMTVDINLLHIIVGFFVSRIWKHSVV